jgi:ribosome maturation factor RimP
LAALFDCHGKGGASVNARHRNGSSLQAAEAIAARVAVEQSLELVEVTLQKMPQGKTLCIYVDCPGGIKLDECERFHKAVQPLLEAVDYDYLEVSSPGVDRPIQTQRDFEKNRGALVEIKLFAPLDGAKIFEGTLCAMDDAQVTLALSGGTEKTFPRKAVAMIRPVIVFEDEA